MIRKILFSSAALLVASPTWAQSVDVAAQARSVAATALIKNANQVPINSKFCTVGDSRLSHGWTSSIPGVTGYSNYGPQTWMAQLSSRRINFPIYDQFSVSGSTTTQALTQLQSALSADCGNILFMSGTNDGGASIPIATTLNNYTSIISQTVASGKHIWLFTESPRGSTGYPALAFTGAALLNHNWMRTFELNAAKLYGPKVHIIDVWPSLYDPANDTLGYILNSCTYDGLHQNIPCAATMAQLALPEINRVFGASPIVTYNGSDLYNATSSPGGAISLNPTFDGTGGTLGSPASGSLATSWTLSINGGLAGATGVSIVASKVTTSPISGVGNWQQIAFSGTTTNASGPYFHLDQTAVAVTGVYSAGDLVEGVCQYEADTTTGMYALWMTVDQYGNGVNQFEDGEDPGANTYGVMPSGPISGILKTPPFTAAGTETSTGMKIYGRFMDNGATAFNATLRFRNCYIHKLIYG